MTLGSHQRTVGASQTHLTPRWILDPLGAFDLDPCASIPRPWDTAARHYTEEDDGLAQEWTGRVWLNPPFNRYNVGEWIGRLAQHGDGIALLHARTETAWFDQVSSSADLLLFLSRRVIFCKTDVSPSTTTNGNVANSGAPVVLAAFGERNAWALRASGLKGHLVTAWERAA